MVRIASVQLDSAIGKPDANLSTIAREIEQLAGKGVQLAVFPECAVTGNMLGSMDEALDGADTIPGHTTQRLAELTGAFGIYVVVGMLERIGERCFNSAVLSGPLGIEAVYRKTHTSGLGVDRFTAPGDVPHRVHQLPFARVGILICDDLRIPEPLRILAEQGAQVICLLTNWPSSSTIQPDVFTRSRAAENRVFVVAADRVGEERGARFVGRSQIVAPDGTVLVEASEHQVESFICDIEPEEADQEHVVVRPGEYEMESRAGRRVDLHARRNRGTPLTPGTVRRATEAVQLPTAFGTFRAVGYLDEETGAQHMAVLRGEVSAETPVLVRVHSECLTGDVLGSYRCDCGEQLHEALRRIDREGGVLVYLAQHEGRGIGLHNKLRAYRLQEEGLDTVEANARLGFPPDMRDFGAVAEILRDLGLRRIRLMTNNPDKVSGIIARSESKQLDLELVEIVPLSIDPNEHNNRYLETKRTKMGHRLHTE